MFSNRSSFRLQGKGLWGRIEFPRMYNIATEISEIDGQIV